MGNINSGSVENNAEKDEAVTVTGPECGLSIGPSGQITSRVQLLFFSETEWMLQISVC
jgi:hypothetical protein